MEKSKDHLSDRIKKLRIAAGLTEKAASEALCIKKSVYCSYESGKVEPCIPVIKDIAAFYHIPVLTLLEDNPDNIARVITKDTLKNAFEKVLEDLNTTDIAEDDNQNILSKLFNGDIIAHEILTDPLSDEFKSLEKEINEIHARIIDMTGEKGVQLLDQLYAALYCRNDKISEECFIKGFQFCTKFIFAGISGS